MNLLLIAFILLFQEPQTVALVFGPDPVRIEIMEKSEAEVLYTQLQAKQIRMGLEDQETKTLAALVIALGTVPDHKRLTAPRLNTRERLDWEIRRGVRRPLQTPEVKP